MLRPSRAAIAVVSLAILLGLWATAGDAPIVDEIPHIGAGYSYAARADMRLNPEHPPLAKTLAGLALLPFVDGTTAFKSKHWNVTTNGQWDFGRLLIFNSGNSADFITQVARLPMLLFFILSAVLLWRWARERYGEMAALMSVILFAFSPTILAHSRFVTTDMAAAWGILASTFFFLKYLRAPSWKSFILSVLALGLALLTKFSTVLLIPFFVGIAVLWAFAQNHGRFRELLAPTLRWLGHAVMVITAAFAFVVWPVYVVHTISYPPALQSRDTHAILSNHGNRNLAAVVEWMSDKPVIRGAGQYGLGLLMVVQRFPAGGNTIYWLGEVVKTGGPGYFPLVYFLKEPLAWWLLVSLALASLVVRTRRRPAHAHKPRPGEWLADSFDELVMLAWIGGYWLTSVTSTLNIGVRHLLPVYPFTILLVSGRIGLVMEWLRRYDKTRLRWAAGIIAVLMGWYVFETVSVSPYYLTYFNQITGGPSGGHRYVVDSNLDWGQDLKRLQRFMDANGVQRIEIDYFGWSDPGYYLPGRNVWMTVGKYTDAQDFLKRTTTDGWIAVSGTFLQNSNGIKTFNRSDTRSYHWLTQYEPETVVGNSIFVWHIVE